MSFLLGGGQCFGTAWLAAYYPSDLPEDWRLDYYANDYPIILLSSQDCLQVGLQDMGWPEHLKAVVNLRSEDLYSERWPKLKPYLQNLQALWLVAVDSVAEQSVLEESGIKACCWQFISASAKQLRPNERLTIIHLKIREPVDLKSVRLQIEELIEEDCETWLFLDASPDVLAQIKTVIDLMGI